MALHLHRHLRPTSADEGRALRRALALTAGLFVVEVAGGALANSLALLSDAGHMLTDLLALGLSGAALGLAGRPATERRTFGYYRLEILSALGNGVLLAVLAGGILVEAANRFGHPPRVGVEIVFPVAVCGLAANVLAFWWLRRAGGGIVTRAAVWHTASDAASSVLVLAAAGVMALTSWWWLDPAVSVVLAGVMVFGAFRLMRESLDVLLESSPRELDLARVEAAIRSVAGVEAVHDLHVWSLTSGVNSLSGHLRVKPDRLAQADRIIGEARRALEGRFGIVHTTLQVESEHCGGVICVLGSPEPVAATPPVSNGIGERP